MGKFPWHYYLVGILLLSGVIQKPLWCQPKQALPVRTFPPGVQVNSPIPINRGNDTLGLEGFMEPEKKYGAMKTLDLKLDEIKDNLVHKMPSLNHLCLDTVNYGIMEQQY